MLSLNYFKVSDIERGLDEQLFGSGGISADFVVCMQDKKQFARWNCTYDWRSLFLGKLDYVSNENGPVASEVQYYYEIKQWTEHMAKVCSDSKKRKCFNSFIYDEF